MVLFQANPHFESVVDILNLPLYGQAQNDSLILNQSQFHELETGGYCVSSGRDHLFHGKPVHDVDDDVDREDPDNDADMELDNHPEPTPTSLKEPLRRSTRVPQPSLRFLETIAHSED